MLPKKLLIALSLCALAIAGCDPEETTTGGITTPNGETSAPKEETKAPQKNVQTVVIPNSDVSVDFPIGWYENPEEYPYDLQYFAQDQRMNTGIFLYNAIDFADDIDADSLLDFQVEDLASKRENFEEIQPYTVTELDKSTVTTTVFSGEKDGSRFYYKFTAVGFDDNPDIFAVTLQVAFPSEWDRSRPVLEAITESFAIALASDAPAEEVEGAEAE